jgi:SulP family sulfate permease
MPDLNSPPLSPTWWSRIRSNWFVNPRKDLLSGLVVGLALIPEALAFSVIAGVDPKVGLYAAASMAIVIAFAGGRSGMISGATGSIALVVTPLVSAHGVQYLLAATILAGAIQIALGLLRVGDLMRFVPRPVMLGFVNALGILLFVAQLPNIVGHGWAAYAIVAGTLVILYGLPRLTTVVPSPLIAIIVLTAVVYYTHTRAVNVGQKGTLPTSLPHPALPDVPFTPHTLVVIAPYALTIAIVGLMESLLTAQLIDSITDTHSDKNVEARGQGIAVIVTGFLGGMAGCALIGQSMINMKNGGRTRLSTLFAGVSLFVLILVLAPLVKLIPMAALAGVMVLVAATTFDWRSITIRSWRERPRSESAVMVVVVAIVVVTNNLAIGVIAGVLLSAILFARRVAHLVEVSSTIDPGTGTRAYAVTGALFFASSQELESSFDYDDPSPLVVIDLTNAHVWDSSAIGALDAVVNKFSSRGVSARIIGLNQHSADLHSRLSDVSSSASQP